MSSRRDPPDAVSSHTSALVPLPLSISHALHDQQALPSLPTAVTRLLELARSPQAALSEYVVIIESDPALTLRLAALANSAFYAHSQRSVTSGHDAIVRLGLETTLAAALSFGLARLACVSGLERIWRRAIVAAVAARYLAEKLCPGDRHDVFTAALLQDIGMLALLALYPETVDALYIDDELSHAELALRERALLDTDHACVGAWLASQWGVPEALVVAIAHSHSSPLAPTPAEFCLQLSGLVADAWLAPEPIRAMQGFLAYVASHRHSELDFDIPLETLLADIKTRLPPWAELMAITALSEHDNERLLSAAQQLLFQQSLSLQQRLHEKERELEAWQERSRLDALTGLASRAYLEEQLLEQFTLLKTEAAPLAIMFIDIDHFKALNDAYGHQLGDSVLQRFSEVLLSVLPEGAVAGRYGGEEFLVLFSYRRACELAPIAQTLIETLQHTAVAQVDEGELTLSVSIGIACNEDADFASPRELIDAADQSMYRIKRTGRGSVALFESPAS